MARKAKGAKRKSRRSGPREAFRFRVELLHVRPRVWRRFDIVADATLWDLHVAIQDVMGWEDRHLHEFRVVGSAKAWGIPDDEGFPGMKDTLPSWKHRIEEAFPQNGPTVGTYLYDFGDDWEHLLVREDHIMTTARLPRCLGGAGACPPEDCGGPWGYEDFLAAIRDPDHPEHTSTVRWVGGEFDPEVFACESVVFSDPRARLRRAFGV